MDARNSILIIDDMIVNRLALRELFCHDYEVLEAVNGLEGLEQVEKHGDAIAIILLDIPMPEMDGYEFLEAMNRRGLLDDIPVIVISAIDGIASETRSLDLGAADLVLKPFEPRAVKKRVENVLNAHQYKRYLESLVATQKTKLARANQAILETLSRIVHHRNMESGQHNLRIGKYTRVLLADIVSRQPRQTLSPEDIELIASATLLHDVGKIVIPDSILNKPDALTPEEFEVMKTHTREGCEIINRLSEAGRSDFLRYAYQICRYHHERWNGEGYPEGLKGEDIPLWAQAVGIADVYDALVNPRVYKPALPHEEAVRLIRSGYCGSFAPEVLESFSRVSGMLRDIAVGCSDESLNVDEEMLIREIADGISRDTLAAGRKDCRYESLLYCLDATVLEIDLDQDRYALVHPNESEIPVIEAQGHFSALLRQLLETAVQEDHRQKMTLWFDKALRLLKRNTPLTGDIECRMFNRVCDKNLWYKVTISNRGSSSQLSRQCLLLFRDINASVEIRDENRNLIKENELDKMTGVFNKITVESKIKTALDSRDDATRHALLVIDVDDFKVVNDSAGHLIGDKTLRATADIIRRHVRGTDIVGRIGGDEFVVLMRNVPNADIVESKVNNLVSSFSKSMLDCHINGQYVTISVGIAIAPWHGQQYAELFECADKALYQAKYFGKAQWRMYTGDTDAYPTPDTAPRQTPTTREGKAFTDRMWDLFLHLERDERGISSFIDAVARNFNLSELIVQQIRTDQTMLKLFDWRSGQNGCTPELSRCQSDCQNIRVAFTWAEEHNATQDERDWCRILARFINEYRAYKQALKEKDREFKALSLLIEQLPAGIYAVDGTYALLFRNKAMTRLSGRAPCAGTCYEQFFGRSEPCPACPLRRVARFSESVTEQLVYGKAVCTLTARLLQGAANNPAYILFCTEARAGELPDMPALTESTLSERMLPDRSTADAR